jgi:hypothetical protein
MHNRCDRVHRLSQAGLTDQSCRAYPAIIPDTLRLASRSSHHLRPKRGSAPSNGAEEQVDRQPQSRSAVLE